MNLLRYFLLRTLNLFILVFVFILILILLEVFTPGSFYQDEISNQFSNPGGLDLGKMILRYKNILMGGDWGTSLMSPHIKAHSLFLDSLSVSMYVLLYGFLFFFIFFVVIALGRSGFFLKKYYHVLKTFCDVYLSLPYLFIIPLFILIIPFNLQNLEQIQLSILIGFFMGMRVGILYGEIFSFELKKLIKNDFSRTWLAFGGGSYSLLFKWLRPHYLFKFLQLLPSVVSQFLVGNILLEIFFQIPGLGYLFLEALKYRDWVVLSGYLLWTSIIFFIFQYGVDLLSYFYDPKLRNKLW